MLRLTLIPALGALALSVGGASASTPVTLELHVGHGKGSSVICGARHHYTLYHRGDQIRFDGTIPGAAGAFKVKVKIKQCVHGRFVTRRVIHVRGHNRHFSGSLRAGGRGFYAVRAYNVGQKSAKRYLRVA
jgi:hypothetical protein